MSGDQCCANQTRLYHGMLTISSKPKACLARAGRRLPGRDGGRRGLKRGNVQNTPGREPAAANSVWSGFFVKLLAANAEDRYQTQSQPAAFIRRRSETAPLNMTWRRPSPPSVRPRPERSRDSEGPSKSRILGLLARCSSCTSSEERLGGDEPRRRSGLHKGRRACS